MKSFAAGFVLMSLFLSGAYAASGHVVTQSGKKFSVKKMTVSVGDVITFVNDDKMVHNIHTLTPGFEFDLGAQKPGEKSEVSFSQPGKLKVRCAIHPKMKIKVTVEG